jgi:hypothetical protein
MEEVENMFQIEDAGEGDQAMMMPQQYSTQKITPKHDPINPLNAVSN